MDPWQKNTIDPRPAWSFYALVNYGSVPLLLVSIWAILRSKRKQAADIFVVGEYSGCLMMSVPCATQCLLNLISGTRAFQYGWAACVAEAFMHVSAIMVQFFSVTLIAFAHYRKVVCRDSIPVDTAFKVLLCVWFLGESTTLAFSSISQVELLPAGTYCFYTFNSPMIYGWFIPIMSASMITAACIYYRIFCITQEVARAVQDSPQTQLTAVAYRVAKRTFLFVLVFFCGWSPAIYACGYALVHGTITPTQELLVGIFGSLHSFAVPLVYSYHDEKLHRWLARYKCCKRYFPHYESRRINNQGEKTMVKRVEVAPASSRSPSPRLTRSTLKMSDNRRELNATPPNPRATLSLPLVV